MHLVSGWCENNFGARLQTLKPEIRHITSCRNVISIEHTASAVFVAFGWFWHLEKGRILQGLDKNI